MTYVWTWEGWLYLAAIVDVFSRRVVGWAIADHLRTELALEALGMALGIRQPQQGLVHHSDRGCQYASDVYRAELAARGIVCSMSRVGDCWDNAVAESFFATLKTELVYRRPWPTKARGQGGDPRLHRCLLQSSSSALVPRLRQSDGLRTATRCRSGSIAGLSTESGQLHKTCSEVGQVQERAE